jgi:anti-sigma factor RsiW
MDSGSRCTEEIRDALLGYLYDECEPDEKERLEAHVATCRTCAKELESLQSVRRTLQAWTPPEFVPGFRVVAREDAPKKVSWWRPALEPSWGLAVAATVVLVVGAAIASVEVRYDADGFLFRMGWSRTVNAAPTGIQEARADAGSALPVSNQTPSLVPVGEGAPWQAALADLERELRQEMLTQRASLRVASDTDIVTPSERPALDETRIFDQLQGLVTQSEQRQQQELALWLTEFAREYDIQRLADQQRIEQEIGALEGVTDYLIRASSPR